MPFAAALPDSGSGGFALLAQMNYHIFNRDLVTGFRNGGVGSKDVPPAVGG